LIAVAGALAVMAAAQSDQDPRETEQMVQMVYRAFPEADATKRIVRAVERPAREAIENTLPFRVHFDELGDHTLFVPFRGRRPVGLFYMRTEEAEWGFMEIGWALDLDLRVLGFQFHRGRNRHLQELEKSAFGKDLIGRDYHGVRELLLQEKPLAGVPIGAEELAKTCLRSAMKALLVTELVWSDEVEKLADRAMGYDAFPAAERLKREVVRSDEPATAARPLLSSRVMYAYGTGFTQLGCVVRTDVQLGERKAAVRWVVDSQGRVLRVTPMQSWEENPLRAACTDFEGRQLDGAPLPDNALQPVATALAAVLQKLGERKPR
jgi:hypothetical protein